MKDLKNLAAAFALLALVSCKKESTNPIDTPSPFTGQPTMTYINLNDKTVGFGQSALLDLDSNGRNDIAFRTEQISYDMNTKVKNVYYAESRIYGNLAVDGNEQTPRSTKGDVITKGNIPGHNWYNVATVALMQKVYNAGRVYWEGNWANTDHQYLPVQVMAGTNTFMGWIEISADIQNETIVLHRAALSKEPGRAVKAGF